MTKIEDRPGISTSLDIVNRLRREASSQHYSPTQDVFVETSPATIIPTSASQECIINDNVGSSSPVETAALPISEVEHAPAVTSRDYRHSDEPSEQEYKAEQYDHPILSRPQEYILFNYLRSGTPLTQLVEDKTFRRIMIPEDRTKFARIFAQSSDVIDVITSCYVRLVDVIARGFYGDLPFEDRISEGNVGLLKAAQKWDISGDAKFSTYAAEGIRMAIYNAIQEQRSSIRIPGNVQQDIRQILRVSDAFEYTFGRTPTITELRQQLVANTEYPISRIDTALNVMQSKIEHVRSIYEKLIPDSEDELVDFIPDTDMDIEDTVLQQVADEETRKEVKRALAEHLTAEEQRIIRASFGLENVPEQTLPQIAKTAGKPVTEVENIVVWSLGKLAADNGLRCQWYEDPPSFIYHMSAERAAFQLGLFDTSEHRLEKQRRRVGLSDGIIFQAQPENPRPQNDSLLEAEAVHTEQEVQTADEQDFGSMTLAEKIRVLRNRGLVNRQIAEELGVSISTVTSTASRLIKAGKLTSLRPVRPSNSGEIEPQKPRREPRVVEAEEARSEETELVRRYLEQNPHPSYKDGFRKFFGRGHKSRERTP